MKNRKISLKIELIGDKFGNFYFKKENNLENTN